MYQSLPINVNLTTTSIGLFLCFVSISHGLPRRCGRLNTCLLSSRPKHVYDIFRKDATTNFCRLAVRGYLDAIKLAHVDLDTALHPSEGCNGSMHAIGGKKGQRIPIRKVDLNGKLAK